ncbi:hypothetical protein V7182_23785 [Neobacillus drentensis]|jgi:hypothetical protein
MEKNQEVELLNKVYAFFIEERGLTEDFRAFMDDEAINIFLSSQNIN